jgi:hypothetical protein
MKQKVQVVWNFLPKPSPVSMMTLKNGQQIRLGVTHELRPEGIPTEKVWCFGCAEYFPSWHHALYRHNLCKEKPKGVRK